MMKTLVVMFTFFIAGLQSLQAAGTTDSIHNQTRPLGTSAPLSPAFKRLSEQLAIDPTNPNLHYFMAITHVREGRAPEAIEALKNTLKYGDGFLPPRGDYFAPLEGEATYELLYRRFESALASIQPVKQVIALGDINLLPEGIAYDAGKKRLLVGSTYRRGIMSVDSQGRVSPFAKPIDEAAPVLGLAINQAQRILYALITNGFLDEAKVKRRNAVIAYDLKKDRKLWQLEIPEALQINDVAIHPNGDLAVTDSGAGIVFMIDVKEPHLVGSLFPSGILRGVNGIAFGSSGKLLYVAHSLGISVWSNESKSLRMLKTPSRETVAAIDGLYRLPSGISGMSVLVGVQNVTNRGRVIRMLLNEQGDEVAELSTVLSHHHSAIDEPTTLAITGEDAFLLARTQVSRLQANGLLKDPARLRLPVILKIKLQSY
jgi:sugar lactone lactonase YvrE